MHALCTLCTWKKQLKMMCFQNDFLKIEFCLHTDASASCCVTLMWLCMLLIYNRIFEMFSKAFRLVFSRMGSIFFAIFLLSDFIHGETAFDLYIYRWAEELFLFCKESVFVVSFKNIWTTSILEIEYVRWFSQKCSIFHSKILAMKRFSFPNIFDVGHCSFRLKMLYSNWIHKRIENVGKIECRTR